MSDQVNNLYNGFVPLPAIKGSIACLTCGCGSHDVLLMDAIICVGFGDARVTRDRKIVWSEDTAEEDSDGNKIYWEGKDAEAAAAKDPNHDWRVNYYAPLYEATYQRQGVGHWVLVEKGEGFA